MVQVISKLYSIRLSSSVKIIDDDSHYQKDTGCHHRVGVQVKRKDNAADHGKDRGIRIEWDLKAPPHVRHSPAKFQQAQLMKKKVNRVPKLKIEASQSRFPPFTRTMPLMMSPHIRIVNMGTSWREIVDNTSGRTPCRAMAKSARDPPIIEAMITDVVANSADISTNCRMNILSVTVFNANSSGAPEAPRSCQFTIPAATTDTPILISVQMANANNIAFGTFFSGSFTSSAMTAMVLNPINAKNMIAAPDITPENTCGKNG